MALLPPAPAPGLLPAQLNATPLPGPQTLPPVPPHRGPAAVPAEHGSLPAVGGQRPRPRGGVPPSIPASGAGPPAGPLPPGGVPGASALLPHRPGDAERGADLPAPHHQLHQQLCSGTYIYTILLSCLYTSGYYKTLCGLRRGKLNNAEWNKAEI